MMSMELSKRGLGIAASLTLQIDARAKALKAEGKDIVGFGAGEPDYDTPAFIKDACKVALDKGLTKYTPPSGTIELKKAICQKLQAQNGLSYEPSQIVISNGAKHSLYNVFQAILNDGDEVIIPAPYWVTYPELVRLSGGVPVFVEGAPDNDFKPTPEAFAKAVTKKTKALMLNSPCNPCGNVYSRAELQAIADLAVKEGFFVVSDEIYEEMLYDGHEQVSIATLGDAIKKQTIVVNGFSKAYAMTGWRLGYTASEKDVAKVMDNIQSHGTSNPNTMAQYAAVVALQGPRDELEMMVKEFDARRKLMHQLVNATPGISSRLPVGAFYTMVDVSECFGKSIGGKKIEGSLDFCAALLDTELVAAVPGIAFGADNFIRLSYATSRENIQKGIERIGAFARKLS